MMTAKQMAFCAAVAAVQLASAQAVLPGYLTDPTAVKGALGGGVDYCLFDTAADLVGANSKSGDPMFKTTAKNRYHLAEGSPAIHAGVTYTGIGNDLDDLPFAAKPSMGCYEFGRFASVFVVR